VDCLHTAVLGLVDLDIIGPSCGSGVSGAFSACLNKELLTALPAKVVTCGIKVLTLEQTLSDCVLSEAKKLLSSSVMATCTADNSLLSAFDKSCKSPAGPTETSCYQCVCPALYVQGLVDKCSPAPPVVTTTKSTTTTTPVTTTTAPIESSTCITSLDCYQAGKICEGLESGADCSCELGKCKKSEI